MDDMRLSGCSLMNKVGIKARTENVCISFDLNDTGKTPTLVGTQILFKLNDSIEYL